MRKLINAKVIPLVRMSVFRMSLEFKTSSTEKYFHSGHPIMFMYITRYLAQTTNTDITDQI